MATLYQSPEKTVRSSTFSSLPIRLFVGVFMLLGFAASAHATQVNFQWNASTGAVAGYKLYQGTASRVVAPYVSSVPIPGAGTTGSMDLDPAASHYVAATAYDSSQRESAFSDEILCHPVTASASSGGAISPSGTFFVQDAANVAFTVTPNAGYRISSLLVNGNSMGSVTSYTLSGVSGKSTVSAVFEPIPPTMYTITVASPANGGISPSGSVGVASGGSKTFTMTPAEGYHVQDVNVDGRSVGPVSSHSFTNVISNHTLAAAFAINTYTISVAAPSNGSISPAGNINVNHNGSQSFTITPASGYQIDKVLVDGKSVGALSAYTFSNVTSARTLSALFVQKPNQAPVSEAGPEQSVPEGSTVTLNGSNSSDPDDGIASYKWVQSAGASVTLSNANIASPTFTAPYVGQEGASFTFKLTVTDKAGLTSDDTCIVNVTDANQPPSANAGLSQHVAEGTPVQLNGSGSTDSDDGIVSYAWQQKAGPSVSLSSAQAAVATFAAPNVGPEGASLEFELTVADKGGLKSSAKTIVNVIGVNDAPVANAGSDQTVYQGQVVTLDGSASSDPDDGIATYRWAQTKGTSVTFLNDAGSPQVAFVAPEVGEAGELFTFTLTVTDASGLQSTDTCVVSVNDAQGPDLTSTWNSLTYSASRVSGSLVVRNVGTAKSGNNYVAFYLSNDGTSLNKLITRKSITSLAAGQAQTVSFRYAKTGISRQYIVAVGDYTNRVTETAEDNNQGVVVIPEMAAR